MASLIETLRARTAEQQAGQQQAPQPQAAPIQQSQAQQQPVDVAQQPAGAQQPQSLISRFRDKQLADTQAAQLQPEAQQLPELPELGQGGLLGGESAAKIAAISPVLLTTTDPRELANILSSNFENVGITSNPEGQIFATNNETGVQVEINKPGLSQLDIVQGLGIAAAFTGAGRVAAIPATLAGKVAVGAAGSGLTQGVIETIQSAVGGTLDAAEIAIAAALGGVAETVLPAIQAFRKARAVKQTGAVAKEVDQLAPSIQSATEAAEATGIPLFKAQKTLVPSELEKQSFIASLPAGTLKASKELGEQNKAAGDAVNEFLGSIAPPEAVVTGAEKFRTAAQRSVQAIKKARSEASSPIYKQAFRRQRKGQIGDIDTKALQTKISQMAKQFDEKDQIAVNLRKVLDKVKRADGNLQKLHISKTEIDQMVDNFGADSVGNTTKRFLTGVKKDLVNQLTEQSPSYRAAREEFIKLSPPVTALEDSIIGKIANIDDTQLKNVSRRLFDPAETNPAVVAKARQVISDVDPDAWNQLVRVELERRLGSIKPLEGEAVQNIPGQMFRAIFGNDKQTKVLFRALDADQIKNLKYLQTALGRAKLGRPGGSQTAAREEIKKELRGGVVQTVREFFQGPIKTITNAGDERSFNKRVRAMAEVMFDPQWAPRMKAIRGMKSDSPAAARAMAQLLKDAELPQDQEQE